MDFEKIAELQNILSEYKKGALKEEKAQKKIKNLVPVLRNIASQINELATSLTPYPLSAQAKAILKGNDTPFRQYLLKLRVALNEIKQKNGTTRLQEAVSAGLSDSVMYDFMSRGPVYNRTLAVIRIEEYVTKHGYDIEVMKTQVGYQ